METIKIEVKIPTSSYPYGYKAAIINKIQKQLNKINFYGGVYKYSFIQIKCTQKNLRKLFATNLVNEEERKPKLLTKRLVKTVIASGCPVDIAKTITLEWEFGL
jgi:hypothetical protein